MNTIQTPEPGAQPDAGLWVTPAAQQPDAAAPAAKVSHYADMIIAAIRGDMAAGLIPLAAGSFAELHDHVDANEYVIDAFGDDYADPARPPCGRCGASQWSARAGDELECGQCGQTITLTAAEMTAADAETAMANAVTDEADSRIKGGALRHCDTCGGDISPDGRRCSCWCMVADALQRYLGRDFDDSADEAARLWDGLDHAEQWRVWTAEYADDHDVPTYPWRPSRPEPLPAVAAPSDPAVDLIAAGLRMVRDDQEDHGDAEDLPLISGVAITGAGDRLRVDLLGGGSVTVVVTRPEGASAS